LVTLVGKLNNEKIDDSNEEIFDNFASFRKTDIINLFDSIDEILKYIENTKSNSYVNLKNELNTLKIFRNSMSPELIFLKLSKVGDIS